MCVIVIGSSMESWGIKVMVSEKPSVSPKTQGKTNELLEATIESYKPSN